MLNIYDKKLINSLSDHFFYSILVMPTATNKGILRLVLVSASNLKCPRGKGKIDPYSEVSMGADQEQKTPIVSSTCNPKWNSNMQFFIKDPKQDVLCITVFDKDYFSPNGKYEPP